MVVTKDYRIIKQKLNSTIAQLSGIQHKIICFFSICIYLKSELILPLLKSRKIRDCRTWSILKVICPEASNVICYDLHTITRVSSGCRNLHSE